MLLADYNDSIIKLPLLPTKVIIKKYDKIKCCDRNNKEINVEVEEIIDELIFRIKVLTTTYTDNKIFVYGTEIYNFHTLDKTYIYTLNVCATQELHRRIESHNVIIQSQDEHIKSQDERIKSQELKILSQDERIKELEAKMTQILNNILI
jgi:hypothetical protein